MTDIRLAAWRERKALSQRDLAQRAGVSQFSISKIETGQQKPRPSTLRKLASALDLTPEELFVSPDEPNSERRRQPRR
ncbi:MAG: helix-turn-helix transcriptional regulator [Chloroflexi bacterium]|nr:helix-turn-helix transcriptional regulator [Chloroflexota bacterium]